MTVFLPLAAGAPLPSTPSFLQGSSNSRAQISKVIKAIMKSRRIVVVCGAGISVQAGIPDFRSPEGLFKTLKRDNPREALASGKDLFDASVFSSEHTTALFCQMIAKLWGMSQAAEPTVFHNVLRALDNRGKLLRVYTQNIDAIEEKCGLSFGIPNPDTRCRVRSKKPNSTAGTIGETSILESDKGSSELPKCVPLHGSLQSLHCQVCHYSCPLEPYLPSLSAGLPPQCPECTLMEETRQMVGKRARGIGRLRPSVVLYNENHKDGEGVGGVVQKDLLGSSKGKGRSGADLLLVVGTSLRVPGTKRMVREFSKAVRSRASGTGANSGTTTPISSPSRPLPSDEEPNFKTIYLNLDFPVPTREWEGVFDAWIQGDAQEFAQLLQEAIDADIKARELASEKKRKREEEISGRVDGELCQKTPPRTPGKAATGLGKKRKIVPSTGSMHPPIPPPQKLFLRIPARPCLVPEVYIRDPPPHLRKRPLSPQQLLTPAKSPPTRFNPATKAGRRAARMARATRREKPLSSSQQDVGFSDSSQTSDSDEAHLLPTTFVRTGQRGLRGAG